jgi:hypothetical protein
MVSAPRNGMICWPVAVWHSSTGPRKRNGAGAPRRVLFWDMNDPYWIADNVLYYGNGEQKSKRIREQESVQALFHCCFVLLFFCSFVFNADSYPTVL